MNILQNQRQQSFIFGSHLIFPRMTSFVENSRWRPDLLKACIKFIQASLQCMVFQGFYIFIRFQAYYVTRHRKA